MQENKLSCTDTQLGIENFSIDPNKMDISKFHLFALYNHLKDCKAENPHWIGKWLPAETDFKKQWREDGLLFGTKQKGRTKEYPNITDKQDILLPFGKL